jgi:hypothetical protein
MITLELEPNEMDYVFKVLTQRPWGEVNSLLVKIQQQVQPPPTSPEKLNGAQRHNGSEGHSGEAVNNTAG